MSTAELIEVASEPRCPPRPEPMITDEAMYELVDGRRTEVPAMSYYAATVVGRISTELAISARQHRIGEVFPEMLFRIPTPVDQSRSRRLDVAFVSYDRWPLARPRDLSESAWDVVPDLAVEVVSPSDPAESLRLKVLEYFAAGVRMVWVVYPVARVADIFEAPDRVRVIPENGHLDAGDVLPGLRLPLTSLFDPPATPAT